MKLLLAEDDPAARNALATLVSQWGYAVTAVTDGTAAWQVLQQSDAPRLALLDWIMPGKDGLEVCRLARQHLAQNPPYLILITGHDHETDLVAALAAGADEYVVKPISPSELQARLKVGRRVVELQSRLAQRVRELEQALASVRQLQGLLPICSYCKKIRDDHNYWQQLEEYISSHSETQFSHSICPDCYRTIVTPELDQLLGPKPADPAPGNGSVTTADRSIPRSPEHPPRSRA